MPSTSPTLPSDGPASLNRPLRPVKWSGSSVVPSKLSRVLSDERAQRHGLRPRLGAFGEEAEHAGGAEVDANRQLPVLPDRLQAQALSPGPKRTLSATVALPAAPPGADDNAAARRRPRRRRCDAESLAAERRPRASVRSLAAGSAALAQREARIDAGPSCTSST
jgi:hypothetical protein